MRFLVTSIFTWMVNEIVEYTQGYCGLRYRGGAGGTGPADPGTAGLMF